MTHRRLPRGHRAYRIGDPTGDFEVFDCGGSRSVSGRWHTAGNCVLYCSEHYSTAMLEILAHSNQILPPNQHYVEINIPSGLSYEVFNEASVDEWARADCRAARAFGDAWYGECRSLLLFVPSLLARMERNILINCEHSEFSSITAGLETPVWWDERLYAK